jgi:hypothetical protein
VTQPPQIRIVRGEPDDIEVAAVVAAILSAGGTHSPAPEPRRSLWALRSRNARPAPPRGPGAWRASGLPR